MPRSRPRPSLQPPRQARSQKTLSRLLEAAESLLESGGLEAATVPAIARRARVSVGSVYRRFPDKDALLRAVYLRFFERLLEANRAALDRARLARVPPAALARAVVQGMVKGYRQKHRLMRALILYAETHPDPEFRRRAERVDLETMRAFETLLLRHRNRIAHPDPEAAIRFGVVVVALVLRGMVLGEESRFRSFTPPPEQLGPELARMYLSYLGLREGGRRR